MAIVSMSDTVHTYDKESYYHDLPRQIFLLGIIVRRTLASSHLFIKIKRIPKLEIQLH